MCGVDAAGLVIGVMNNWGQIPINSHRSSRGGFWRPPEPLVLRGWSAGTGLTGGFMIHEFKDLPKSCTTRQPRNTVQSRTAWGPFFERKTRKMGPHGGWLKRDFHV